MSHVLWKPRKILVCCISCLVVVCIIMIQKRKSNEITRNMAFSSDFGEATGDDYVSPHYVFRSFSISDDFPVKIPLDTGLDELTEDQIEELYWDYINTIQTLCQRVIRVGNLEDGGKEVCIDEPYRPRPPCMVYSFGIMYQWDFDEDAARLFGCEVFSFDPSMLNMSFSFKYTRDITFYKIGLGPKNEVNNNQWTMKTLGQIRRHLNHTKRQIDILKIDIEGSEWTSLPQMVMSGTLRWVKQMQIELHGSGTKHDLKVLRMLYESGFRIFMRDRNQNCTYIRSRHVRHRTACMEISMIRVMY